MTATERKLREALEAMLEHLGDSCCRDRQGNPEECEIHDALRAALAVPEEPRCACTWEAGDSPCPVHGMNEEEPPAPSPEEPPPRPAGTCSRCGWANNADLRRRCRNCGESLPDSTVPAASEPAARAEGGFELKLRPGHTHEQPCPGCFPAASGETHDAARCPECGGSGGVPLGTLGRSEDCPVCGGTGRAPSAGSAGKEGPGR